MVVTMYKKYMHSCDRRTNPTPVNEGLISWAKGKIDNFKKERAEKKRLEEEKKTAEREANEKARIENNKKLFKVAPKTAYAKIQGFVKEVLKDKQFSDFKNAKALPTDYHKRFKDSDFDEMVEAFFNYSLEEYQFDMFALPLYLFNLPEIRSEQQSNTYDKLAKEFENRMNEKIKKMDPVYKVWVFVVGDSPDDAEGYYYEPGKTTVIVDLGLDL